MRFTEGDHRGGYLHGILLDGAKPFLYRSGVRDLLGVPDGGGSVSYAPPPPPAGFQYAQRFHIDGRDRDVVTGDHEVVREYPDRIGRSAQESEPPRRSVTEPPAASVRTEAPRMAVVPSPPAGTSRAAREPGDSTMPLPMPSVGPSAPPAEEESGWKDRTSLDVPGISRVARDFPALRSSVDPEELRAGGRGEPSVTSDEHPAPAVHPAPAARSTSPVDPAPPGPPAFQRVAMPSRETPPPGAMSGAKGMEIARGGAGAIAHRPAESATVVGVIPPTGGVAPFSPDRRTIAELPMPPRAPMRRAEVAEGMASVVPVDPLAGAPTIRGGAAGRLEQMVERAVARRVAEELELEPRRARAPEPVGRVVVVRAPAREKIPCAFWERSYLHRFRIMTLR